MKYNDVVLIRRILDGDETAFADLVRKHQKPVHTLAWRKIGDFHIAEEITQDVFLKVYQRLHTLKEPHLFSGWLYVITTNLCATWLRKKRIQTQPLEDTETTMLQEDAYSQHISNERAQYVVETQREVVKKLLAKLKESERTVMTLHYLGEMTVEEISKFLGVSAGTIKSRLQRARNRLKKEETVIKEALEYFQITPNLTENILKEVSHFKPTPSTSKPLVPWAIATTSTILIVLMLGLGSQHLLRFQPPYSLDAQAETTVELVDALVVLNLDEEPDVKNQIGSQNQIGEGENNGQKQNEILLAEAQTDGEDISVPKKEWIQENGPVGHGHLLTHFPTHEGEIYIVYNEGRDYKLYKLPVGKTEFQYISDITSNPDTFFDSVFMAKWNNTLYFVGSADELNELFASSDDGVTWGSIGRCPEGWGVGFEELDDRFYLALEYKIFVSDDIGKTWNIVDERLTGEVSTLKTIQNTLFAATSTGLYHLEDGNWQRMQFSIPEAKIILSFVGTEKNLYVLAARAWQDVGPQERTWWLFRSTDKGQSWTDITPTNALPIMGSEPFEDLPQATLVAEKNTVLLIGWSGAAVVRSVDNGNTWTLQKTNNIPLMPESVHNAVALNENTFYLQGHSGMYRSIDGGISWTRFNPKMKGSIIDVISVNTGKVKNISNSLYVMFTGGMNDTWMFKSGDKGKSWQVVNPEIHTQEEIPSFTRMVESGGVLYAKRRGPTNWAITGVSQISEDRNMLVPIKGMPVFSSSTLSHLLITTKRGPNFDLSYDAFAEQLQKSCAGATQFFKQLARTNPRDGDPVFNRFGLRGSGLRGALAVSGDTFYMEHNYKLFRWEPGDTEWSDTGQEETIRLTWDIIKRDLKLAVSGDTVYVGKRDGNLVVSLDKGNNWIDLTSALPFPVKAFKDIVIVGNTVYVATDTGAAASDRGNNWGVITDSEGTNLVMEHLAVDSTILYGVTKDTGIYRLENDTWNQVVSEIPEKVTSLAVHRDTLYVGTQDSGMLHYTLAE